MYFFEFRATIEVSRVKKKGNIDTVSFKITINFFFYNSFINSLILIENEIEIFFTVDFVGIGKAWNGPSETHLASTFKQNF